MVLNDFFPLCPARGSFVFILFSSLPRTQTPRRFPSLSPPAKYGSSSGSVPPPFPRIKLPIGGPPPSFRLFLVSSPLFLPLNGSLPITAIHGFFLPFPLPAEDGQPPLPFPFSFLPDHANGRFRTFSRPIPPSPQSGFQAERAVRSYDPFPFPRVASNAHFRLSLSSFFVLTNQSLSSSCSGSRT